MSRTINWSFRVTIFAMLVGLMACPAAARIQPYPTTFKTETIPTTSLYVRVGGKGPAVVLLHGYGETGDMWAPLAAVLVKDHTVIVPDLRGMRKRTPQRPSNSSPISSPSSC